MSANLLKGVVRNGRVEVTEPMNLPEGSEVTITPAVLGASAAIAEDDRPMSPDEIAATLAAMQKLEPFDMTDEEQASAAAWEQRVNDYSIANLDRGLEDVLP